MEIGDRIRLVIDSKGMKDVWVADGAGISKTTLSNIICGTTLDPSVSTIAAIADVLGESVDALLGRVGHPLLAHEQDTLRSAVTIITDRVLGPPNDQRVATTPLRRRRPKTAKPTTVVTSIAATLGREIFTDIRELPRHEIPRDLRDQGVRRVFVVEGDSMTAAQIFPGDLLYIRTDVTRQQAADHIVACEYDTYRCVKRLRVLADQSVVLASESENDKHKDVVLTPEQADGLVILGVVVRRLTAV